MSPDGRRFGLFFTARGTVDNFQDYCGNGDRAVADIAQERLDQYEKCSGLKSNAAVIKTGCNNFLLCTLSSGHIGIACCPDNPAPHLVS